MSSFNIYNDKKFFFEKLLGKDTSVYRDVVLITTNNLIQKKSELRFCAGSNPACGVWEICDGQNL